MRQKDQSQLNSGTGAKGEAPSAAAGESEVRAAKTCLERPAVAGPSMEAVVERDNLKKALAQVKRNKGAAGIDGMSVGELPAYLNLMMDVLDKELQKRGHRFVRYLWTRPGHPRLPCLTQRRRGWPGIGERKRRRPLDGYARP
jgi:hypothetical protein